VLSDCIVQYHKQRRLISEAKAARLARKKFLSSMNHELRNPLNGIYTSLQVLDELVDEEARIFVKNSIQSYKDLRNFIENLLRMSEIDSGYFARTNEIFSLSDVVNSIEVIFKKKFSQKKFNFCVDKNNNLPALVVGDPSILHQILMLILDNSSKYSSGINIILSVDSLPESKDGFVNILFYFYDSGLMITDEMVKHLFLPPEELTIASESYLTGSGFGLVLAKNMIDEIGGAGISIDNKNDGAHIYFSCQFVKKPSSMQS